MNIEKIESNFNRLPEVLQLALIALFYPILCIIGILTLAGWIVFIDWFLR